MIGRTFLGRYEITRLLGEGGMGRVYLAKQIDFNRQVVVKVMNESVAADEKFRDRFQRETLLMAKLQHPYIVTLIDAALNDPLGPCIVMEYVRGVNLEYLLGKNKRFSPARVGRILGQLCEALQAAHELGIIHRDLKPSNIMMVDPDTPRERIKVMDFGLAKVVDKHAQEFKKVTDTNVEFAVGTPGYISPEQVRGEEIDHRSDLYSVGVLAFELLTGQLPFPGNNSMDVVLAHATELPPSFEEIGLAWAVPPYVEEVVMQCLEKQADNRPQTASELAERFDLALVRAAEDAQAVEPEFEMPPDSAILPQKAFEDHATAPEDDPNAIEFQLEAWMPQKIALLKLRGFVQAKHGEVLESEPGRIRVRLDGVNNGSRTSGPLSWFGRNKNTSLFLDLKMANHPARDSLLQIQARFRSGDGKTATDPAWKRTCIQQFIDLRGFLIGATEGEG